MYRVGGEVSSRCGKCKTLTEHKILALTGDLPVQVECLLCRGKHKFRPLEIPKPKKEKKKAKDPPTIEIVHSRPSLASRVEGKVPIAYAPEIALNVGEAVAHPAFGTGIVLASVGARAVEVEFPDKVRRLAHDVAGPRPPSKLEYRTIAFDHSGMIWQ